MGNRFSLSPCFPFLPAGPRCTGHLLVLAPVCCCGEFLIILFHRPESKRAVGAHTGEDDADALVLQIVRERSEEEIDGQPESSYM